MSTDGERQRDYFVIWMGHVKSRWRLFDCIGSKVTGREFNIGEMFIFVDPVGSVVSDLEF